jgi:xylulose-5-phosphate/fructose-6-phosphate phosphoketolase
MANKLNVDMRLQAKYSDGYYYPAVVVAISESKKRAKAPVKVHFVGYDNSDDAWLALEDLKSKKLPKSSSGPNSKVRAKAKAPKSDASPKNVLSSVDVDLMDGYWRAVNYLTVGQIYLRGHDPLLKKKLESSDIKARLLGHWGTCPGLSFAYAHMNRLIKSNDLSAVFIAGPGHGGPGIVAHTYLEGTYPDIYPEMTLDKAGMGLLMKQFSWPRGIPSHVAPFCPGSLHEGGELGYCLLHATGAVLDNPDLLACCVVGDGEAETGPAATSWNSARFINPKTDGAVLPILHLNGGRIAAATVMSRLPKHELLSLFRGYGYKVHFVEGNSENHFEMHQKMAATLDRCLAEIKKIQKTARATDGEAKYVHWPMIVLRTPKGWTGPKEISGSVCEGTYKAHQVPIMNPATKEADLSALDEWLHSYKPEELFTDDGQLKPQLQSWLPAKELRMGVNPQANGGTLLKNLILPELGPYEYPVPKPGISTECTPVVAKWFRDIFKNNPTNFRMFCPDEITSNKMSAVFEATGRQAGLAVPNKKLDSPFDARDGRVMEILSEHCCQGWMEAYVLSGRHGVFPCYESFAQVCDSMVNQHCKWLKASLDLPWRKEVASLNYILTSHTWRQDHNGYSHQSPGFIDNAVTKPPVTNVFLPPDANTLLVVARWCMQSRMKVNLMVCGKHPMPQWLSLKDAETHVKAGAGIWKWAGTETSDGCDLVLACAGDVPTLEVMAAAQWLRTNLPNLRVRVVNIVDLFSLSVPGTHVNSHSEEKFEELYGTTTPVVMFYHGTPATVMGMLYNRRSAAGRFGIHGYIEEGSTTTPFDLTVFNEASRFHIIIDALERVARANNKEPSTSEYAKTICELKVKLVEHKNYIWEHGEDMPEIRDWQWTSA